MEAHLNTANVQYNNLNKVAHTFLDSSISRASSSASSLVCERKFWTTVKRVDEAANNGDVSAAAEPGAGMTASTNSRIAGEASRLGRNSAEDRLNGPLPSE